MVPFFMQGDALGWFKWMHSNKQLSTWEAFTRALELRFGPSSFTNHEAALFKLKQHGSVLDFQLQFETLSNCVEGLSPTSLLNCFISDLKDEIQHELAVLKPTSLAEAIRLAKLIEAKTQAAKPPFFRHPKPPHVPTTTTPPSILGPPPAAKPSLTSKPPPSYVIKHLTPAEQQERRAKGLCFNCDERFSPAHRCKLRQFLLLLSEELKPPGSFMEAIDPSAHDPKLKPP